MSITFGIFLLTFTAGTGAWATVGDRVAALSGVARIKAFVNGGYNIPSETRVDALVLAAEQRKRAGVSDRDEVMRHTNMTYGENYEAAMLPHAISEAAIEAASDDPSLESWGTPTRGLRALLAGGYAMPERYEVDLAAPHTLRGNYKARVPAGWIFADEDPIGYQRSIQLLAEIGIRRPVGFPVARSTELG